MPRQGNPAANLAGVQRSSETRAARAKRRRWIKNDGDKTEGMKRVVEILEGDFPEMRGQDLELILLDIPRFGGDTASKLVLYAGIKTKRTLKEATPEQRRRLAEMLKRRIHFSS